MRNRYAMTLNAILVSLFQKKNFKWCEKDKKFQKVNSPRAESHCRSARQNKYASISSKFNIELTSDWREGGKALRPFPRYFQFRKHSPPPRCPQSARLVWP